MEISAMICKVKNLRTLLTTEQIYTVPVELYQELTCLRALDLGGSDIDKLPNEVGRLLHLRYLNLWGTNLSELPETICNLYNLQTLELSQCKKIQKLPSGIGKLTNLRHLSIGGTDALGYLPQGIGSLRFLRTLSKFIVRGSSMGCNLGELKLLTFLQGNLKIEGLERVVEMNEAAEAELRKKNRLRGLTLNFGDLERADVEKMKGVLKNLHPHENLEELEIMGYPGLQFPSWITSGSNLVSLKLHRCGTFTELPAAMGKMECLEKLEIVRMGSVRHIGREFYGVGIGGSSSFVAFPKLKSLLFRDMVEWDDWDLPISKDINVMPQLLELRLEDCSKLRKLPALGRLQSLELLTINTLNAVKRIGSEFCGVDSIDSSSSGGEVITAAFPKLKKLFFSNMKEWEEWELPISTTSMGDTPPAIMPCLCELELSFCPVLRALPGLGKLKSLESLTIVHTMVGEFLGISDDGDVHNGCFSTEEEGAISSGGGESTQEDVITFRNILGNPLRSIGCLCLSKLDTEVKRMGGLLACFGNSETTGGGSAQVQQEKEVIFPSLKNLEITVLPMWRGSNLPSQKDSVVIMPLLRQLTIRLCDKLQVIPHYMFSQSLKQLEIMDCPELGRAQPCLPPLLESLDFAGNVGFLSNSLPVCDVECSHNNNNSYPYLKTVYIFASPHSSLPKGFNKLKGIQRLILHRCDTLDFELKELNHLTMLQHLEINDCPILKERFGEGRDWSILSHVPKITIDYEEITKSN
ncbi:hypothetical protein IFM89_006953 [Coptis chinensis]|uniref:R13L1/DRL21-like LRR repeat region domain-containing protein n=1 Tax=Coptis chinensis TaxID=261450 RepID=A0A835H9Y9_9MAGN|nr:hypothetical protein IFM89_006953 [Coptis chinensis]